MTAGIIRVAFGQEHYFALERLVDEVALFSQHVQSYLRSSRSDVLKPLPLSFGDGEIEVEPEVDADASPRMPILRPAEPTSSIDDLRNGAFTYVKDPKGEYGCAQSHMMVSVSPSSYSSSANANPLSGRIVVPTGTCLTCCTC